MQSTPNTKKAPCEVLLASSPFGVAIIDKKSYQIQHCNPKFITLLDSTRDAVIGKSLLDVSPRYQDGHLSSVQGLIEQVALVEVQLETRFYWWLGTENKRRLITEIRCFEIPDTNNIALFIDDATDAWLTSIAIKDMIREVNTNNAQDALNNIVRTLSNTFHLEFVYIAQANKQRTEATTLALIAESKWIDNVTYDLSISPCLEIYKQRDVILYDGNLKASYSHNPFIMKDWDVDSYIGVPLWDVSGHFLGHFAACKRGKLEHQDLLISFLKKYSSWAALQIERITKEKELNQLNKEKDRLLSILSHDLRGPIGNLEMMLELFLDGDLDKTEFLEMAADAKHNIVGLRSNMETLLEWTYRQAQQVQTVLGVFPIREEVQSVFDFLRGIAQQKGLHLSYEIPQELKVYADRNQINLVLRNLISNAFKFTPYGGTISVYAEQEEDKVIVAVKDTGIGITEEKIATIFQDHTTQYGTNGEKGTGLGLSLCQEIIEQHHEKIWVESQLGNGSSFYFSLSAAMRTQIDKVQ